MTLRMNYVNHLKALQLHIMGAILLMGLLYFLDFQKLAYIVCCIAFIFWSVPITYLHLEYYFRNRGQSIEIDENSITLIDREKRKQYLNLDLRKVIVYKSGSFDGGIPYLPTELYQFASVTAQNGDVIIVTCLLTPDVERAMRLVKGVTIEVRRTVFPALQIYLNPGQ